MYLLSRDELIIIPCLLLLPYPDFLLTLLAITSPLDITRNRVLNTRFLSQFFFSSPNAPHAQDINDQAGLGLDLTFGPENLGDSPERAEEKPSMCPIDLGRGLRFTASERGATLPLTFRRCLSLSL